MRKRIAGMQRRSRIAKDAIVDGIIVEESVSEIGVPRSGSHVHSKDVTIEALGWSQLLTYGSSDQCVPRSSSRLKFSLEDLAAPMWAASFGQHSQTETHHGR